MTVLVNICLTLRDSGLNGLSDNTLPSLTSSGAMLANNSAFHC